MKPEHNYADLLSEASDHELNHLVQELDRAYTAPQRPAGLSWATASHHLTLVPLRPSHAEGRSQRWPSWRLPARRRASWALVTAAALVLALLGAGSAGPLAHWFGGSASTPFAYAAVNQSVQISNRITLTAVKGYVDPKHLVLYYDVQLSSDLSSKYAAAFVEQSTLQGKKVQGECETSSLKEIKRVAHCAVILPSGGDIAGDTSKVTWHISEVGLVPFNNAGKISTLMKGDWTLQFSIPFSHQAQNPLPISFPR